MEWYRDSCCVDVFERHWVGCCALKNDQGVLWQGPYVSTTLTVSFFQHFFLYWINDSSIYFFILLSLAGMGYFPCHIGLSAKLPNMIKTTNYITKVEIPAIFLCINKIAKRITYDTLKVFYGSLQNCKKNLIRDFCHTSHFNAKKHYTRIFHF